MSRYKKWKKELFAHFSMNHDLHLLESEMDDIEWLIMKHLPYLNAAQLTVPPNEETDK